VRQAITQKQLNHYCGILDSKLPNAGFSIGYAYGQPRLEAERGSRDVSPRGTKREVYEFVRAMIIALDYKTALDSDMPNKITSYKEVIEEQKVTIADLQKENETLKATIAREKVASIELEASDKGRYFMELYKGQDN